MRVTRCDTLSDGLAEMLEPELAHVDTTDGATPRAELR
jgi:hypothetical protein